MHSLNSTDKFDENPEAGGLISFSILAMDIHRVNIHTSPYTTPSISSSTNNYVYCSANGCTSARTLVVATVNTTPVISSHTTTSPASCYCSIALAGLSPNTPYIVTYEKNGSPVSAGTITTLAIGELIIGSLLPADYDYIILTSQGCSSDPYPSSGVITLH